MAKTNHFSWALAVAAGVLAAVGMLALITMVVSEPAGAAFPGKNGKIAFESNRAGSNDDIYTMNPNGTGVDRLTNNAVADNLPAWSPDGTKIAFMSSRDDPRAEIYTMNANGTALDRLTNDPANDSAPAWSPDGTKIAFGSSRNGNQQEIYTMNANGTTLDRLTNDPEVDFSPAWSPDGNKIAFGSKRDGNPEIYTMNPNGTGVDRLTNNAAVDEMPAWSPDGTKIAFMSERDGNREIYTMNSDGTGLDRLTNNGPQQSDAAPAWQSLSAPSVPKVTAPKIKSTVPKANATGVAPAANITATFSEDMVASTINKTTFKLLKKGSTTKIAAAVGYSAAPHKATLNPTNSLRRGVTYQAVVTKGAKDLEGNSLDQSAKTGSQQKSWFFTVRK